MCEAMVDYKIYIWNKFLNNKTINQLFCFAVLLYNTIHILCAFKMCVMCVQTQTHTFNQDEKELKLNGWKFFFINIVR